MPVYLREGQRAWGSEWVKNHPRAIERLYRLSKALFLRAYPLFKRLSFGERFMIGGEKVVKGWMFNCQMCGQCILHSTGMTCPMNCPKNLRNGPCGGVRPDGHCEVIPELPCIWVQAWERSQQLQHYQNDMNIIQPPVNRYLQGTSSWMNMASGVDMQTPKGWSNS